ncbi:MAG: hypothetical protein PHD03_04705, partial [Bacilli bacterium]|nr:hypothetical protein [Bacilli bacterium]MDD4407365.1 hypothetical protein [Bacilli bacterium]
INITKLLFNKSSNSYLKNIIIDGYNIKFNKRIKQYNLAIKKSDHTLNINAVPEDDKAVINIIGNEDLKDGSVIKIIVKAENESKINYQINITNKDNSFMSNIIYLIITIMLFGLLIKYFVRIKKYIIKSLNNMKKKITNKHKINVKEQEVIQKAVINKPNKKVADINIKKDDSKKEKPSVTKKKPSEKNNSKPQISSGRISATKKKPINKKTKKKQLKTKKQNKKRSTKK